MFHIVLYQPEIPPNTGNVMRLAANTGCRVHIVQPAAFQMSERRLRRAALDYGDTASVESHADWRLCRTALGGRRVFALSTRARLAYASQRFEPGDAFVFGPETRGLPADLLAHFPEKRRLALPMRPGSRSLNLSNAVAVVIYEAWRQQGFNGAAVEAPPAAGPP
ncbi:MAG: tRNA (cytidine(34)-2'-O)-methyltransferase [Burkholderiales bacterium]|nr:tRNA (cytidine(34)-2'-O)-methyltransferase [Burkholderiales bacterium]